MSSHIYQSSLDLHGRIGDIKKSGSAEGTRRMDEEASRNGCTDQLNRDRMVDMKSLVFGMIVGQTSGCLHNRFIEREIKTILASQVSGDELLSLPSWFGAPRDAGWGDS